MNTPQTDTWLDVLQGRASANEPVNGSTSDTGQLRERLEAQGMRQYYEARLQADLAQADNPARERRLRNLVQARLGDATPQTATPSPSKAGLANRLGAWLQSLQWDGPTIGAATAAAVLGLLVGPLWLYTNPPQDDWTQPKSAQSMPPSASPAAPHTPKRFEPTNNTQHATPQAMAERLQKELAPLGIEANIQPADPGWRLSATVEAHQREAAMAVLQPYGLTLPENGQLKVRLR